jgi:ABC-type proline/glycine betaine transport system ATPase subunit
VVAGTAQSDVVLQAHQPVEAAFAALAASDAPIAVQDENGKFAGVLTRQAVFQALARQ